MTIEYFVAYLKDYSIACDKFQDFDQQCKFVQTMDERSNLIAFLTKKDGQVLAIIPRENILAIGRIEREVEEDE